MQDNEDRAGGHHEGQTNGTLQRNYAFPGASGSLSQLELSGGEPATTTRANPNRHTTSAGRARHSDTVPPPKLSVDELTVTNFGNRGQRMTAVPATSTTGSPAIQLHGAGLLRQQQEEDPDAATDVDAETSSEDVVEPYSMITQTGGIYIDSYTQLLALLQRTCRQYKRHYVSLISEVVFPLIFVVLIIVLNLLFGSDSITERIPAFSLTPHLNDLYYKTYFCYNDSSQPIAGLESCSVIGSHRCDGDESGIPVYGLCYSTSFSSAAALLTFYLSPFLGSIIAIPRLDSIIAHQWMAKKSGLASSSRTRTALAALSSIGIGASSTTRFDSISYSGLLYFAPAANVPPGLIPYFRQESEMFDDVYGGTFDTVAEAERAIKKSNATQQSVDSVWGLIVINDIVDGFDVQIRLHGSALPRLTPVVSVEYRTDFLFEGTDMYLASGYMSLQKTLYDYFYNTKVSNGALPNVAAGNVDAFGSDNVYVIAGSFPYNKAVKPYLFSYASSLVAFILVLAFLYPFSQMTKRFVLEKELRIRESMCIMGLTRTSLWSNFLLVNFIEYLILCILLTVLLCGVVETHSDPFVFFLILLLYSVSLIPLSGLVSTFFSRARMAALMSPLIYFVLSMPIFAMGSAARAVTIGLSFLSPTALAALMSDFFTAVAGGGFHISDLSSSYYTVEPRLVMVVLSADVVIYTILMLYFDAVLPQEWGTTKEPLFFIREPYRWWKLRHRDARHGNSIQTISGTAESQGRASVLERSGRSGGASCSTEDVLTAAKKMRGSGETADNTASFSSRSAIAFDQTLSRNSLTGLLKEVGMRIDSISKHFTRNGKPFAAVRDVSWNLYRGEISVLLGPNGAGKSTAINMITGMLTSDTGDCMIEGHSITRATAAARHHIGFCPQHNILWPDLTCREHLEFYGKIKGLCGESLENAVVDMLRAVDLEEKKDIVSKSLSGGQKRKLSVAVAFVGRNRVVLLDEPTAGMDAAARRHTWSLLRMMAKNRTILLTTHFMDEADLLGDNVAIINDGMLQCTGSTQFLRHYAGVGYTLRFDLTAIPAGDADVDRARQAKVKKVWEGLDHLVRHHLLDTTMMLQTDAEVEYELPHSADEQIPSFLRAIEDKGNRELGLRGYALQAPTLEDVFMRVVEHHLPTAQGVMGSSAGSIKTITGSQTTNREMPLLPELVDETRRERGAVATPQRVGRARAATPIAPDGATLNSILPGAPLRQKMSRASVRFYNGETSKTYGNDAARTELAHEEDEDPHSPPSPRQMSPLTVANVQGITSLAAGSNREGGEREDLHSETTTIAATVLPKGSSGGWKGKPVATTATTVSATSQVQSSTVLYKHVTDRHLDQIWATRSTARGQTLWALQLRGMLYKRFLCAIRDSRMMFFQVVCPIFCILLAMLLQLVTQSNSGTIHMTPEIYGTRTSSYASRCAQYYGDISRIAPLASKELNVELSDPNFYSSADMSNELLDTWFVHKYARYMELQCIDPYYQAYIARFYSTALESRTVVTIMYNTSSHHSLPIGLHTAYAVAYYAGLASADSTFSMSVATLPTDSGSSDANSAIAGILIGIIVLIPFTFLPANPVAWVVKEYETRARHLQTVSGLRYLLYWTGNFCFDFAAYVVTIIFVMVIFVIFQRTEYIGYANIGATILSFTIYGVCYCCGSYMVSFFFTEHTSAQLVVMGVSFLTGFLCVMLVFVLGLMTSTVDISNTLRWVCRVLPPYSIGEVIINLALLEQKKLTDSTLTAWSPSITLWPDIYMAAEIPIFVAGTLLWDHPNRRALLERVRSAMLRCWNFLLCGCFRRDRCRVLLPVSYGATVPTGMQTHQDEPLTSSGLRGRETAAITPCGATSVSVSRGATVLIGTDALDDSATQTPQLRRRRGSTSRNDRVSFLLASPTGQTNSRSNTQDSPSPMGIGNAAVSPMHLPSFFMPIGDDGARAHVQDPLLLAQTTTLHIAESPVGISMNARRTLLYPPSKWYKADAARLREEDSDVEEERIAVYEEEQRHRERPQNRRWEATRIERDKQARKQRMQQREQEQEQEQRRLKYRDALQVHLPAGEVHATGGGNVMEVETPESHLPTSQVPLTTTEAAVVRVVDLRKVYAAPHKVAVGDLNFSLMHGEVFGFLGTNGAGKSSAMSILTQEQLPTSGRAYVCGYDVVRESAEAANNLGYCPQFDASIDLLTVTEHLRLYALIRGVPVANLDRLITSLLTICNLAPHRHVLSSELSGGNRRKLSVAISLIGAPRVVCLDEPSAGLDPLARRLLWRALDRVSRKCSIILTTHHLEEVEALADCVGIMVDGGLRCFGDLPHLKHKYARNAYELTLHVSAAVRQQADAAAQMTEQVQVREDAPSVAGTQAPQGRTPSANRTPAAQASSPSANHARHRASVSYAGNSYVDTSAEIFQFMKQHFPSALLIDTFNNERYVYTLPATRDVAAELKALQEGVCNERSLGSGLRLMALSQRMGGVSSTEPIVRLSEVFAKLQEAKAKLGITQYSVSHVSLEQVFLRVCSNTNLRRRHGLQRRSLINSSNQGQAGRSVTQPSDMVRSTSSNHISAAAAAAATAVRARLSVVAPGAQERQLTFAEYRRQRAALRLREEEEEVTPDTLSAAQRVTEPDNEVPE